MRRRDFLARAGALAVAPGALAACSEETAAAPGGWAGVRAQFALRERERNFAAWYLASHPKPVRAAIERHRRGLDASPHEYVERHVELEGRARAAAAAYLDTKPEQIALTDSTTMGLGLLYGGIAVAPGQELVTSDHDFYATHEALRVRAARMGAKLRKIRLYARPDRASVDEIVSSVASALTPRTRVLALTWVHSSTGVKLPVRAIARLVAERNRGRSSAEHIFFCLDGVHGFGVEADTPDGLGVDFLVSGCHKWLFGPRGTGLVWGRAAAWPSARPTIPAFSGGSPARDFTPGGFHSFEHRWALAEAFRLHGGIGKARVASRIHALNRRLKDGLASMPHVTLLTPRSEALSAGIVVFDVARLSPNAVVSALGRRRIVATVTPYTPSHPRLAPGLLNTPGEVDRVLAAVRALR